MQPFEWTVTQVMDSVTNLTKTEMIPSHLGKDETYRSIYYWFTIISFVINFYNINVFYAFFWTKN